MRIELRLGFEEVGTVHAGDSIPVRTFSCRRRCLDASVVSRRVAECPPVLVEGFRNNVSQCLQMVSVDAWVGWKKRQSLTHSPAGVCTREMFRRVL